MENNLMTFTEYAKYIKVNKVELLGNILNFWGDQYNFYGEGIISEELTKEDWRDLVCTCIEAAGSGCIYCQKYFSIQKKEKVKQLKLESRY